LTLILDLVHAKLGGNIFSMRYSGLDEREIAPGGVLIQAARGNERRKRSYVKPNPRGSPGLRERRISLL
jgi:hypothetical protein